MAYYLTIEAYNETYIQNIGFVNLDQLSETQIHLEFAPAILTDTSLFSSNWTTCMNLQHLTTNSSLSEPNWLPSSSSQPLSFNAPSSGQLTTTSPISNPAILVCFCHKS